VADGVTNSCVIAFPGRPNSPISGWKDLMKLPFDFSIKFIFRLVLPGVVLAAAFVPAVHAFLHALGIWIKFEYLFPIEVIAWGWVVVVSDTPIYMLFEGRRYWPAPLRKLLM
jgi:hypothetical protein